MKLQPDEKESFIKLYTCILFTIAFSLISPANADRKRDTLDLFSRNDQSKIIFLGDMQRTGFWERVLLREQNDNARQAVINAVATEDPAFLLILGDLVSSGDCKDAWTNFDSVTSPVRQRGIPMVAVLGNHEYFGERENGMNYFFSRFQFPEKQTWTSVRCKNLTFLLLNSNFKEMTPYEIELQQTWYLRTLNEFQKDSTIAIIIVACHNPPFTNSTIVSESKEVQARFVPAYLNTPKARLFISGHCHSYERFLEKGKTFVVSGGAGGPRQKVIVDPKRQRHHDIFTGPAIRPFHYCKILIEQDRVIVQMVKLDDASKIWSIGDEFPIPKN